MNIFCVSDDENKLAEKNGSDTSEKRQLPWVRCGADVCATLVDLEDWCKTNMHLQNRLRYN